VAESFPRQHARTRRFTLGAPRSFGVSPDGRRVVYLRSAAGDDPRTSLWCLDLDGGGERLVVDGTTVGGGAETAEERARRERVRESASGVVGYSLDRDARRAAFVVGGAAFVAELDGSGAHPVDLPTPEVFDARLDPAGRRLAWCASGALWVAELGGDGRVVDGSARRLAVDDDPAVRWGQAEFVAAEEMGRRDGYWWAPDGRGLLAARVDDGPVPTVWIADPAHPRQPPAAHRYPLAGSADADVSLWWIDLDGGGPREVTWDRERFPYLPALRWPTGGDGRPLLLVEQRDHRAAQVLAARPEEGTTELLAERHDPAWVAWADGTPDRLADGRLLWSADVDDTRRLTAGDEPLTPAGLQVRAVVAAGETVVFTAWSDPTTVELWRWSPDGLEPLDRGGVVLAAAASGGTVVVGRRGLERPGFDARVVPADGPAVRLASHVATPAVVPTARLRRAGARSLRAGLVLPTGHRPGRRLPVLLRPYGGPGAQRVLADHHAWLEDQWWADQGFAVVVVDGRGTPGRSPAWERSVHHDVAGPVLEDQVDGLRALAAGEPDLDLGRVGIMGWSFGGYLSALAVLRRPDVFHAAVAGAPVTEWRLYDTYYTERLLGRPDEDPGPYDRTSLLAEAARLERPLMVVHGLADDNVLVAHSLLLSQRLLEAGRSHAVLPLTGITHMASQEEVAENLLALQLRFLADALRAG
jgi:dipeptidyl-peptidase-4